MAVSNDNSSVFRRHFTEKTLHLVESPPTHHIFNSTNNTFYHTWIDLFLIKDSEHLIRYTKSEEPFTVGHDFIEINYATSNPPPVPLTISHRNLKNITSADVSPLLTEELRHLFPPPSPSVVAPSPLSHLSSLSYTADEYASLVTSVITNIFDRLAPIRTFSVSTKRKPWVTADIRHLMSQRKKLYKRASRFPFGHNIAAYRTKRNDVCNALATAKNAFIAARINRAPSAATKWRELHKLGLGRQASSCPLSKFSADDLNAHFSAVCSSSPPLSYAEISNVATSLPHSPPGPTFDFTPTNAATISRFLNTPLPLIVQDRTKYHLQCLSTARSPSSVT